MGTASSTGKTRKRAAGGTWTTRRLAAIAVALFAAAVAAHIACGEFPKAIDVLPDERRYLDIARSLFSGSGLIIRGDASDFQKILYPLSLFPALAFPDGQAQVRAIGVLNSLYACSSVFPALAIARKLFERPAAIVAAMTAALLMPDLMYSMTFMSESLFVPLSLWLVYACWRSLEASGTRGFILAAFCGVLCYATYLCKEIAWIYLIAFCTWHAVALARRRRSPRTSLVQAALFLEGFFIPFLVLKLTLFAGLGNSYSQFSFDILLSPYTVLFGIYALALDGLHLVVAFGVFPVLYLAAAYRDLPREKRDLLLFCLVALLAGIAAVVFTVSMREDVGHVELRQHVRYVAPLALPLLLLFADHVTRGRTRRLRASRRRFAALAALTAAFCCLVASSFGVANFSQGFDFSQFHVLRWLLRCTEPLEQLYYNGGVASLVAIDDGDGALLAVNAALWAVRAGVVAFTAAGMALLVHRDECVRRSAGLAICGIIVAMMAANSVALYSYNRSAYGVEEADVEQICAISDQLAAFEGAGDGEPRDVTVVLDAENTGPNNLVDTYLQDGTGAYRYLGVAAFNEQAKRIGSIEGEAAQALIGANAKMRYILANRTQDLDLDSLSVTEIGFGEGPFVLYEVR